MERLSEKLACVLYETIDALSQVAEDIIKAALDRLAAYEDTGLDPEDFKRAFTEATLLKLTAQYLGTSPERLRELLHAEQEGRLLILDEETALALAAVVYGCDTNRRLIGATHMWDFRGRCGGPKQITYSRAIQKLNGLAENVLNKGGESDGT